MMGVGGEGGSGDSDHVRCVLMTLRLLLRDEVYQVGDLYTYVCYFYFISIYPQRLLIKGAHSLATLAKVCNGDLYPFSDYILLQIAYISVTVSYVNCAGFINSCRSLS